MLHILEEENTEVFVLIKLKAVTYSLGDVKRRELAYVCARVCECVVYVHKRERDRGMEIAHEYMKQTRKIAKSYRQI